MVREAVEVAKRERIELDLARRGDRLALGAPDDGPGEMKLGRSAAGAGQDEAAQRLQLLVHRVDLALEPVDLRLNDSKGHFAGREILAGRGEIGAEIEQFVLDRIQQRPEGVIPDMEQGEPDRAVGFVDVADRPGPDVILGNARAVDQPGFAVIAGPRIDLAEPDQGQFFPPAIINSRIIRMMATA